MTAALSNTLMAMGRVSLKLGKFDAADVFFSDAEKKRVDRCSKRRKTPTRSLTCNHCSPIAE